MIGLKRQNRLLKNIVNSGFLITNHRNIPLTEKTAKATLDSFKKQHLETLSSGTFNRVKDRDNYFCSSEMWLCEVRGLIDNYSKGCNHSVNDLYNLLEKELTESKFGFKNKADADEFKVNIANYLESQNQSTYSLLYI